MIFLKNLIEVGIIVNWMFKKNISHTHVHFANPAATVMMIASFYKNISYSMSVHGPDIFYNIEANILTEKIKKALFVRCISFYCQSQLMRIVSYNYWQNFHIIRCGIDPKVYIPRPEPLNDKPELLCVGRLVSAKGQHILLQACSKLSEDNINYHLTFVGDGEDRPTLELSVNELNIKENITFTGAIGQDDVLPYYEKANIFVLASFAEGVPVVLMEAMAKEIPSISTRITGIPELIENNVDGILVDSSNVSELAQKLKELITNPDRLKQLGVNGRKKVLKKYDLNANCKALADIFEKYI